MLNFKKQTYISIARNEEINERKAAEKNEFRQINRKVGSGATIHTPNTEPSVPEGLYIKCGNCGDAVLSEDVEKANHTCPKCGYNFRI